MLLPQNRVVMITGANRGIGLATAQALSSAGFRLSLGVRDVSTLKSASFANETFSHQYDALDKQSIEQWTQKTLDHYGAIDALVLNAGVMVPVGIVEGSEEDLDLMWDVNFKGPLRVVRATLDALKRSGHGRVVNVVSLSGKRVMGADNLGYCASKFAALALTHAIRQEGWDSGLRATAVCPGLVDTDMVSHVTAPDGQFKITPEAIAATAAYALSLPNDATVAEILVNSRLEHMM
ncbi:MAG: SDR family NAD(P)-dependent oxidoreductase [Granulosicoccus sp.]|nr:SDR family NAD(P)-dependent oxidoreductase [Granulosicoccus sp.]